MMEVKQWKKNKKQIHRIGIQIFRLDKKWKAKQNISILFLQSLWSVRTMMKVLDDTTWMANKVVSSRNGFHFLGVFCKVKALLSEEGALMATKQLKKRALHNKTRPSSQVRQGVSCHWGTCELDSFHFLNFPCFPNLLWPVCCWVWKNRGWPWIFLSDSEKWLPTSIYQRVLRFWLGLILIKLSLLFFFLQRVSFWGKVAMSNKSELQKPHSASISVKLMALSMAKRGQFYWDQRTMGTLTFLRLLAKCLWVIFNKMSCLTFTLTLGIVLY